MKPTSAGDNSADTNFTIALGSIAFLIRAVAALALAREPVWDGHYYHFGAERIAQGLGYSEDVVRAGVAVSKPWAHYPVGYSAFLAPFYRFFGSGLEVAPIANALASALTVVIAYQLARRFLSPVRAKLAGCLVAFHPGLIAYTAAIMTEGLASLLLLLAGYLALRSRRSFKGAALFGAALGFATLVRPTSLLVVPLLLLIDFELTRAAFLRLLLAGVLCLAVVAPWTVRNCLRMDGCALISTNGGWNLAIGALSESGRFQTLSGKDGCRDVTGQVQQDRCWAEVGLATIARDPLRWLRLIPEKLSHTFNHESFIVEYLHEADPVRWNDSRRATARALLTAFHWGLLFAASLSVVSAIPLLALFGRHPRGSRGHATQGVLLCLLTLGSLWALRDDYHPFWPLAVIPAGIALARLAGSPLLGPVGRYLWGLMISTALVHAMFFGDDRYHLVVSPVLCILAAAALRVPTRPDCALGSYSKE